MLEGVADQTKMPRVSPAWQKPNPGTNCSADPNCADGSTRPAQPPHTNKLVEFYTNMQILTPCSTRYTITNRHSRAVLPRLRSMSWRR